MVTNNQPQATDVIFFNPPWPQATAVEMLHELVVQLEAHILMQYEAIEVIREMEEELTSMAVDTNQQWSMMMMMPTLEREDVQFQIGQLMHIQASNELLLSRLADLELQLLNDQIAVEQNEDQLILPAVEILTTGRAIASSSDEIEYEPEPQIGCCFLLLRSPLAWASKVGSWIRNLRRTKLKPQYSRPLL